MNKLVHKASYNLNCEVYGCRNRMKYSLGHATMHHTRINICEDCLKTIVKEGTDLLGLNTDEKLIEENSRLKQEIEKMGAQGKNPSNTIKDSILKCLSDTGRITKAELEQIAKDNNIELEEGLTHLELVRGIVNIANNYAADNE